MTEAQAREILKGWIQPDNSLEDYSPYIRWPFGPHAQEFAALDGDFTADQCEAIAWWMRHQAIQEPTP